MKSTFNHKLAVHLLTHRLPSSTSRPAGRVAPKGEAGFAMGVVFITVLAIIIATAALTSRSLDGLLGSRFQGDAKDARLVAESGTAYIISEWNKPNNRRLYQGLPMADWKTNNPNLVNPCTGDQPAFTTNTKGPDATALQFANGNEVSIDGDPNRRFRLLRVTVKDGKRANEFETSLTNPSDGVPFVIKGTGRGHIELEVEGRVYRGSNLVSKSVITREFEVEPKCCQRSFGGVQANKVDPVFNENKNANDRRTCYFVPGSNDFNIADLAIITGLSGGGLQTGSGSNKLFIKTTDGNVAEQIVCIPPENKAICGGTFDTSPTATINTKLGDVNYVARQLTIPPPPSAPTPLTPLKIDSALTINPTTITTNPTLSNGCVKTKDNGGLGVEAIHCAVDFIALSGNGATLKVDTGSIPVYLYVNNNISVTGKGLVEHTINGTQATATDSDRFQLRGVSPTSQTFDFAGNSVTGFTIWAPNAATSFAGTSGFSGLVWTNDLTLNGATSLTLPVTNSEQGGTCVTNPLTVPCLIFKNSQVAVTNPGKTSGSPQTDWTVRSITFTKMF